MLRLLRCAMLLALAPALMLAAPGFAADGVIEISQACGDQTGCFPGDTPGLPITISESGSYRLTSSLDAPAESAGVEITGSDVSLDLAGFSIRGAALCDGDPPTGCSGTLGAGVVATGSGARVRDGTVRGFADGGVVLAEDGRVEDVEAARNGRVGIEVGDRGRIHRSHAIANAGIGISVGAEGSVRDALSSGNAGVPVALGLGAGIADSTIVTSGSVFVTGGVLLSDNICNASPTCARVCTDADGDGFFQDCLPFDCEDGDPSSSPAFPEICDGLDNDCNGLIDDGCSSGSLGEGEICTNMQNECAPGLLCCYPCGIPGCEFVCQQPLPPYGCPAIP